MDYLLFFSSAALIFVVIYILFCLPNYVKEGLDLFWREKNARDLKKVVTMCGFILIFSVAFFCLCSLIIFGVWDELQQNMMRKLSRVGFVISTFLLFILIVRTYSIRKKAIKAFHLLCENNIVDVQVEKKQKNLWLCRFSMYGEELWGYLDEKPSDDIIKVAVLKYNNRKKMYLLQEMH